MAASTAIAQGVLAYLRERGIDVALFVAKVIGVVESGVTIAPSWLGWILAGTAGLVVAALWPLINRALPRLIGRDPSAEPPREQVETQKTVIGTVNIYTVPNVDDEIKGLLDRGIKSLAQPISDDAIGPAGDSTSSGYVFDAEADGSQHPLTVGGFVRIEFQRQSRDFGTTYHPTVFTASNTGRYEFFLEIDFSRLDSEATGFVVRFRTSNKDYYTRYGASRLREELPIRITLPTFMDAGDTAECEIRQNDGKATTTIAAGSRWLGNFVGP